MERKKITFDSFIRGVILGVIIISILMLLKRLAAFYYLSLSLGLLPIWYILWSHFSNTS